MLKLLTKTDQNFIKMEYTFRFINVFFVLVIINLLVYGILNFAHFIVINSDFQSTIRYTNEIENSELIQKQKKLSETLSSIETEYNLFNKKYLSPNFVIFELLNIRNEGVAINIMELQNEQINIQGIAENREALIQFVSDLNNSSIFENANVPVASFTINKDIPFSFSVSINLDKNND